MASFNKIIIVGYLGRDAEIRYTPQGTAVSNFSIATSERRKDRSGEAQEMTTWFRVSLWGKQAEALNQYLTRGKQVYVEGKLRTEEFTDRDGNKRQSLEVTASDIQLISSRGEAMGGSGGGAPGGYPEGEAGGFGKATGGAGRGEDEVPF